MKLSELITQSKNLAEYGDKEVFIYDTISQKIIPIDELDLWGTPECIVAHINIKIDSSDIIDIAWENGLCIIPIRQIVSKHKGDL